MFHKRLLAFSLSFIILITSITGCTRFSLRPEVIKIAIPNTIDSLPIYIAEDQGYFYDHLIKVELIQVASEEEGDTLLLTGQVDAAISDLISVIMMNQTGLNAIIVRTCLNATPEFPYYRIITSPSSGINQPDQLRNQPIAVSGQAASDYVTELMLEQYGVTINEISTFKTPMVADRYSLVLSGKIPAATLPEPWASIAIHNGAKEVLSDASVSDLSGSVIVFRTSYANQKPDSVKGFLAGFEDAVNAMENSTNVRWNDILTKYNLVPSSIINRYTIPKFPFASVPNDNQFVNAFVWATGHGYIQDNQFFETTINASFLPAP